MKITAETIKTLRAPADGERTFWDEDVSGFGLRVRSSGARSWIFKYRIKGEETVRRFTIGDGAAMPARAARDKAADMWAAVRRGDDPQAQKLENRKLARVTFGGMIPEYLEHKTDSVRPRTLEETTRYLMKHCAALHGERLDKIGRADLADALAKIKKNSGPVAQARAYAALSDFFGWALGTKCAIEANPLATMNKPEGGKARDRVLKADELAAIWNACEDDDFGRIVRLLILTLQRRNEVGEMERIELDLDGAMWTIAAARAKNNRAHDVPLAPLAIELIEAAPAREGEGGKLRPQIFGQGAGGFSGWSKAKIALDARITEARDGKALDPWTLHDLRRTGATMMAETLGTAPHIIEAILNHVSGHKAGVAGIYNRATYATEKKAVLLTWADHVRALASGGKVIPLRRAKA
jgi:integrase